MVIYRGSFADDTITKKLRFPQILLKKVILPKITFNLAHQVFCLQQKIFFLVLFTERKMELKGFIAKLFEFLEGK